MPVQEIFFDRKVGNERIQVLKTYDAVFAREAFAEMEPVALNHLSESLSIDGELEINAGPDSSADYADILWDELLDSAREDGQISSFFVVRRFTPTAGNSSLYVSGDWPSAEGFVKQFDLA
jgi:hypothetical protein